jgi:hypothetical protein
MHLPDIVIRHMLYVQGCLCCAGAELTDATEAVALAADECTLAAGCIGDLLAAQVPCPLPIPFLVFLALPYLPFL